MDDVVKEIKALRAKIIEEEETYVNKIKFESVMRVIEEEGLKNSGNMLKPSVYRPNKSLFTMWWGK